LGSYVKDATEVGQYINFEHGHSEYIGGMNAFLGDCGLVVADVKLFTDITDSETYGLVGWKFSEPGAK
jgi:hypothetical protein